MYDPDAGEVLPPTTLSLPIAMVRGRTGSYAVADLPESTADDYTSMTEVPCSIWRVTRVRKDKFAPNLLEVATSTTDMKHMPLGDMCKLLAIR
jgi:hypothetical protein